MRYILSLEKDKKSIIAEENILKLGLRASTKLETMLIIYE